MEETSQACSSGKLRANVPQNQFVSKLVSVIVPVYNRMNLVGKTLDSILNQTYPFIEIVVVNDGSTDDSLVVVQKYAVNYPDKVIVIDQINTGQARARNNGLKQARGEFIAFLDSDDTWEKEKLAKQIPLFVENIGLVYCAVHEVDEQGNIIRTVSCESKVKGNIYGLLLISNRMTGGSVVVTRMALDRVGIFDESLKAAENWDLWIRISKEYYADYVNEPLVRYLKHQNNISLDISRMSEALSAILKKHLPERPSQVELKNYYDNAYANYYYLYGVLEFSRGNYDSARKQLYKSWQHKLFYKDSITRVFRSFLGAKFNKMLSGLKRCWAGDKI